VAYDAANNNYFIVYNYLQDEPVVVDIRGKLASAGLSSLSVEFQVASGGYDILQGAAVAAGPNEYLVVWEREHSLPDTRIYGRRLGSDGIPVGGADGFQILPETASGFWSRADVALEPGGSYLVVAAFHDILGTQNKGIFGRYVMPGADRAVGEEIALDEREDHYPTEPAVACAAAGVCLMVEMDEYDPDPGPAEDLEILGRLVAALLFGDGFEGGSTGMWSSTQQ
jgi:hypothetical protein